MNEASKSEQLAQTVVHETEKIRIACRLLAWLHQTLTSSERQNKTGRTA